MKLTKRFTIYCITTLLFFSCVIANAQMNDKYGAFTYKKAINVSGKQRMLTQKMSKAYLYLLRHPEEASAKTHLMTSKVIYEKKNDILLENTTFKETKNKIGSVKLVWKDFKKAIDGTPTYENAKKILDLNTDLLKASNNVVQSIIKESKIVKKNTASDEYELDDANTAERTELLKIINICGRQRMLAQRLALYYFANESLLKNSSTTSTLNFTFNELDGAINMFTMSEFNTPAIDEKVGYAITKWEFFKKNRKQLTNNTLDYKDMYKRCDELTNIFNEITSLYEKVSL